MPFVRVKRISGKEYAYFVENTWQPQGSRQKVLQYLGKVFRPQPRANDAPELALGLAFKDAVLALAAWELRNHGFAPAGGESRFVHAEQQHSAEPERFTFLDAKGHPLTIAMNEGFLCETTLKQLLEFTPKENRESTMKMLASAILEAGLKVSPETFAELFEKVQVEKPSDVAVPLH